MTVTINRNVILTAAQAKAEYTWTGKYHNGKPVFFIPTKKVLTLKSGFEHKKLCDGPTFTLGLVCCFGCTFCYVEIQLILHAAISRIRKETGLDFQQIIVERDNPLPILRTELVDGKGRPRYSDPADERVIYASPLVDVAANLTAALQTIAACRLILENTNWQIRLLSKSALLKTVAEGLGKYRDRVIYGLSTGTFDDHLTASFEMHTSSPTARLRTLHWLQDNEFRTFGMICPSLPQEDYEAFARAAAEKVRVDRCEHVWAEVLNVRGQSLVKTCAALRQGGFEREAQMVAQVGGPKNKGAWEQYARATFLALAKFIPPEKLRFMQYVQAGQNGWWQRYENQGAVLLGKHAGSAANGHRILPETAPPQSVLSEGTGVIG